MIELLPIFMIGLLGGVHCVGMCGGIVGAITLSGSARRIPIAVVGHGGAIARADAAGQGALALAYNTGRIASYMAAGALAGSIAGGLAGSARLLPWLAPLQGGLYWLANLMLILLGLSLMNAFSGLAHLEKAGALLWRRLQPLTRTLLPADSFPKALLVGAVWGWVPCAMVYSVLTTAMLAGSAAGGARVMLAFGLGTLPLMLGMTLLGSKLQQWLRQPQVRIASGAIVLLFGLLGWWRAAHGLPAGWLDSFCISAGHGASWLGGAR